MLSDPGAVPRAASVAVPLASLSLSAVETQPHGPVAPPRPRGGGSGGISGRARRVLARVPGLAVLGRAILNYVFHQSANQAGHVAFSAVLAMFPLLLFVAEAASFLGDPGAASALVGMIAEFAPPGVAEAVRPVVDEVLGSRNRALLTIGLFGTIWAASSGAQAIRMALNRAYGVEQGLPFWKARIKVIVFTVIGTVTAIVAFSSIVVLPYVWLVLERTVGVGPISDGLWIGARYGLAFAVLVVLYATMYGWLPDVRLGLRSVLPGAVVGAALWLGVAALLSLVLRNLGKLTLVYGSFAGMVATLVFLYLSAVTLIFGAELNAVLRQRRHERARAVRAAADEPIA